MFFVITPLSTALKDNSKRITVNILQYNFKDLFWLVED